MVFLKAILEKISRKIQGICGKYSIYWVVSEMRIPFEFPKYIRNDPKSTLWCPLDFLISESLQRLSGNPLLLYIWVCFILKFKYDLYIIGFGLLLYPEPFQKYIHLSLSKNSKFNILALVG